VEAGAELWLPTGEEQDEVFKPCTTVVSGSQPEIPLVPARAGNLTTWLRENKPRSHLFVATRVVDQRDLNAALNFSRYAAQVMDGVGVYAFGPIDAEQPTTYRRINLPRDIELSALLFRACQDIAGIAGPEVPPDAAAPAPVRDAAEIAAEEAESAEGEEERA
jgi:hypothetical protein